MGAKVRKNWIGRVKYKLSFGGVCGFLYGKHKKKIVISKLVAVLKI